ncbi:hypothetical protein [Arthrobacter dokdonensis]|uniref:hypothetical protein n=1 Tax=Arthrobacter dokdonellae TaxID=2211210 RepID=UPI001013C5A0|nr:hypothetical protein [Arthrobacter dokdonellae]
MHLAFGYFSGSESYPEQPKELHKKIATSGTCSDRWHLAGRDDLSPEVIAILAQDSDPEVRSSIAVNQLTPAVILASLANQHPDLVPPISIHTNAPPALKELAPILWQTDGSIFQYLVDKGATQEESTDLRILHSRLTRQHHNRIKKAQMSLPPDEAPYMEPPRTPLLGGVWRSIHTEPSNDAPPPYDPQFLRDAAHYWEHWSK